MIFVCECLKLVPGVPAGLTLWEFIIAIENGSFADLPIPNGEFPVRYVT
jgi:hypothetical protein